LFVLCLFILIFFRISKFSDDLDLCIVGGYYGKGVGYRSGTLSHFMLGKKKLNKH